MVSITKPFQRMKEADFLAKMIDFFSITLFLHYLHRRNYIHRVLQSKHNSVKKSATLLLRFHSEADFFGQHQWWMIE